MITLREIKEKEKELAELTAMYILQPDAKIYAINVSESGITEFKVEGFDEYFYYYKVLDKLFFNRVFFNTREMYDENTKEKIVEKIEELKRLQK